MRLIHLLVPDERRDDALAVLDEQGIDYLLTREARDEGTVVVFPLPAQAVDAVLDDLREAGVDDPFVVITNAETARTPHFRELEERFVRGSEEGEAVVAEEIESKARGMLPGRRTYYAMTLLSVFVATAGLLLDSPAVVVGSMVIAPQVGAALTASAGLVFGDRGMLWDGFRLQVIGLLAALLAAAMLGVAVRGTQFVPSALTLTTVEQISSRTSPGVLSVVVGLSAGVAGAFGLSTDLPVSLVGVAVAAALIPAAAAVGIGLAWGVPTVAVGAAVLLVVNLLTINLAGGATLWMLGYRPSGWESESIAGNLTGSDVVPSVVALLVLTSVVAATGGAVLDHSAFENEANVAVDEVLEADRYSAARLVSVTVEIASPVGDDTQTISVVVQRPAAAAYPELPDRIRRRIAERTGRRVAVSVELRDRRTAGM